MNERLLARPGYLVRRLHQVHSTAFAQACTRFGVTPVQYSLMTVVADQPGIDRRGAAAAIAVDRFVMADVAKRLEAAGLLASRVGEDRRTRALHLTERGRAVYAAMRRPAQRAHDAMVAPLPPTQRAQLLRLLRRLVDQHDSAEAGVRTGGRNGRTPRANAARGRRAAAAAD